MVHGEHVAEPREALWRLRGVRRASGWQVMGPRVSRLGRTRPLRVMHPLRWAPPYIRGISLYLFVCGTNLFLKFRKTRGEAWRVGLITSS